MTPPTLEEQLFRMADRFRSDRQLCVELYGALCNIVWWKKERPETRWACSWRYAGGLAADLCGQGEDYLDYYCSGNEQMVGVRIREILGTAGWEPAPESLPLIGRRPGLCEVDLRSGETRRLDQDQEEG